MTVYRIEHKDQGVGPFRAGLDLYMKTEHCYFHDVMSRIPTPWADKELGLSCAPNVIEQYVFGFASLAQVAHVFAKDAHTLHDNGFALVVVELPKAKVKQSTYQVAFRKEDAKKYKYFELTEIFG
jgi:hypothetical protein